MKRKVKYLVSIVPAIEGSCHIATSCTYRKYKANGVSGRKVISNRLSKL